MVIWPEKLAKKVGQKSWPVGQKIGQLARKVASRLNQSTMAAEAAAAASLHELAAGPSGFPCARARWPRRATSRTAIGQGLCPQLCSTLFTPRRQQDSSSSCSRRRSTSSQPAHAEHASSSVGWRGRRFSRRSSSSRRRSAIAVRVGELSARSSASSSSSGISSGSSKPGRSALKPAARSRLISRPSGGFGGGHSRDGVRQQTALIGCQWPPCSTCGAPWRPLFALSCLCCRGLGARPRSVETLRVPRLLR